MKLIQVSLCLFLCLFTQTLYSQWVECNNVSQSQPRYSIGKIVIVDSLHIRAIGAFNSILYPYETLKVTYSNNGGEYFNVSEPINSVPDRGMSDIACIGKDTTFLVYTKMDNTYNKVIPRSFIYRGTGVMSTFTKMSTDNMFADSGCANFIHFFDSQNGIVLGDPNGDSANHSVNKYLEIYVTHNTGVTWSRIPRANMPASLIEEYSLMAVNATNYCVIGDNIWFVTNYGRVFKSIDRGQNWTVTKASGTPNENTSKISIVFKDEMNGLVYCNNNIYRTEDGGETWKGIYNRIWDRPIGYTPFYGIGMASVPGTNGLFIGSDGTPEQYNQVGSSNQTLYSYDGTIWKKLQNHNDLQTIGAPYFLNENVGYIGGREGIIYKWAGKKLPPKLEMIYPNGGETLGKNRLHSIEWSSSDFDSLSIHFSIDSGKKWTLINPSVPGKGKTQWMAPDIQSDNCLFKLVPKYDSTYYYVSKAFSLVINSGIEEKNIVDIKIYPNPVQTIMYIESPDSDINTIIITDMLGQERAQSTTSSADFSNLPSGVYFIKIICDNGTIVKKILKNN